MDSWTAWGCLVHTIAGDLKLGPNSESGTGLFGEDDALLDAGEIALKIQTPLVKSTCSKSNKGGHGGLLCTRSEFQWRYKRAMTLSTW